MVESDARCWRGQFTTPDNAYVVEFGHDRNVNGKIVWTTDEGTTVQAADVRGADTQFKLYRDASLPEDEANF